MQPIAFESTFVVLNAPPSARQPRLNASSPPWAPQSLRLTQRQGGRCGAISLFKPWVNQIGLLHVGDQGIALSSLDVSMGRCSRNTPSKAGSASAAVLAGSLYRAKPARTAGPSFI